MSIFRNDVGQVMLWIISTKSPTEVKLGRHQDSVLSLAFSKQDNLVVSGGHDGGVIIWDTISQRQLNQLQNVTDSPIYFLAFSSCGQMVFAGLFSNMIIFSRENSSNPCKISVDGYSVVLDITVNGDKNTIKFAVYDRLKFLITEYAIPKLKVHVDTLSEELGVNLLSDVFNGSFDKNESEIVKNDNDEKREKETRKMLLMETMNSIGGGSINGENVIVNTTSQGVIKRVKSVIVANDKVSSHNSIGSYHDGLGEADCMKKEGLLCSRAESHLVIPQLEDMEKSTERDTRHLLPGGYKTEISDDSCLLIKDRIFKNITEVINFMELFQQKTQTAYIRRSSFKPLLGKTGHVSISYYKL